MSHNTRLVLVLALFCGLSGAQESHRHDDDAPERLGEVSFPISCQPSVQSEFNRAVALLHSFAYAAAADAFRAVADHDPRCAMAHWGVAMSYFRQQWQPPIVPASYVPAQHEIELGLRNPPGTDREQKFIRAAALIFQSSDSIPYETRALKYEQAMSELASADKSDTESQVFYALALLANVSPGDKTHARQKQAAALLEPLFRQFPQHPGIPHYLIHAYDNAELAPRGLEAAKKYSKIAPSAPHALHMPSHIFTRLGLWEDSIASNTAAREAARRAGDTGEELHSMDYLVYAYLQLGRDAEALQVVQQLRAMQNLSTDEFKVSYASTAMPVRYLIERGDWAGAANVSPVSGVPPQVSAIAAWARGLGFARSGRAAEASRTIDELQQSEQRLRSSGNNYWETQVRIMRREVSAWQALAQNHPEDAVKVLRQAADEEDSLEKLPLTPGPIVPAREQLGQLLLQQGHSESAAKEFQASLVETPGRRGSMRGLAEATARTREHRVPQTP